MVPRRFTAFVDSLRRSFAVASAALVLALTVFGASPALHNWLHTPGINVGADGCAVVQFASGVALSVGAIAPLPPAIAWRETPAAVAAEIFLTSPRYLRQPERGPPVR